MDNVSLIVTILLIAAINAFIIAIWVNIILKIRLRRELQSDLTKKEEPEPLHTETPVIPKQNIPQEGNSLKSKTDSEGKEEISKVNEIKDQPKLLKYTSEGYIDPQNDINRTQHNWR
jgi:cytoskeletal protein RodZ